MKITKNLTNNNNHFNGVNPCKYITVHDTANKRKGANALMHARYINNGSKVTWHYTVDDTQVVQHYINSRQCWHAGDGKGAGNTQSIGIEMCVNSDGNFRITVDKTAELVAHLMLKHNIPIERVVQHNHWSGKNCPTSLRQNVYGITWNDFINKVKSQLNKNANDKNTSNKKLYKVQVGAYSNKENAVKLQTELRKKGYDTFIKYE